jgi:transposase
LTAEQQQALKVELTTHIYSTAFQVIAWIDAQWQVQYEVSAVHKLLKRLGFTPDEATAFGSGPRKRFYR